MLRSVLRLVAQSCLTLCDPTDCSPPGSSVPGDSPGKNTGVPCNTCLPCPPLRDLPNPGIEPRSPAWPTNSLLTEPPGKPKNTGVSSLSLLQEIFPTQESKQGLLHYKWILYQLSYKGTCLMIQQSHCWAYTLRKPEGKETRVPQCSSQHCL